MSASAIISAPGAAGGLVLKVEEARALLKQATQVDQVKEIHDKAKALETYYRQDAAALDAQQDAGVVRLMSARRIGELLEEKAERGERQGRGDAGRAVANAPKAQPGPLADATPPATLKELGIERHQAQRFQQLAKVPEEKFDKYVQAARESRTEITTAGLLNHASKRNPHASSRVNDGEPDKNDKFTPPWLVKWLVERFGVNWDFAGHPTAPATKIIGKKRIWTIEDDCLLQDWGDLFGLGNWEWDKLNLFVPFAFMQIRTGAGRGVAQPMPSTRTEQRFWQEFIEPFRPDCGGSGAEVRFVRGPDQARARYGTILDPEGLRPDNAPGMPTAVVIFRRPFHRSPDVPPQGTVAEVLEEMRFGDDVGLTNLWQKVLPLARGEVPAASRAIRENPVVPAVEELPLAKVGINALVDEATGYQDVRPKDDLRRMLKKERAKAFTAPPDSLLSIDRFKGEATDLGFSAKLSWTTRAGPGAREVVQVRCLAKGCRAPERDGPGGQVFRIPITSERLVERDQLQQLRQHSRSHAGAKTKKRGKR